MPLTVSRKWGEGAVLTHQDTGEVIAVIEPRKKTNGVTRGHVDLLIAAPEHIAIEREEEWAQRGGGPKPMPHHKGVSFRDFEVIEAQWEARLKEKDAEIMKLRQRLEERIDR